MDIAKAIEVLKPLANSFVDYANITMKEEDDDTAEALEMAIDALKAQLFKEGTTKDAISRQEAIDALDCINGAEEVLRSLPSVQPEPQWIPVSERVPKDYVDVLVWFEYFRYGDYNCMYATHGIGNYSKEYNSWTINHETGWKDLHVFAWMPLPEPYLEVVGDDES